MIVILYYVLLALCFPSTLCMLTCSILALPRHHMHLHQPDCPLPLRSDSNLQSGGVRVRGQRPCQGRDSWLLHSFGSQACQRCTYPQAGGDCITKSYGQLTESGATKPTPEDSRAYEHGTRLRSFSSSQHELGLLAAQNTTQTRCRLGQAHALRSRGTMAVMDK